MGDKENIFIEPAWYRLTGKIDSGWWGTHFPLVEVLNYTSKYLPWSVLEEEVNIVPADLDYFITEGDSKAQQAHFTSWEEPGKYTGQLLVVPV